MAKHMLQLVSPVGWCWSLECLGRCPVVTLCWRQNDHGERCTQDRAKCLQAWDHTHTHTRYMVQTIWQDTEHKICKWCSCCIPEFSLPLCKAPFKYYDLWWKSMQRPKWPGNPKMLSAICAVLYGKHHCVNEESVDNHSTAEARAEKRETIDCMF